MELDDTSSTKICVGCCYVITSKYLSLNGEDWHSSCIRCDECESPVFTGETTTKFHTQDGKIYCKDCVTQLFQVCADCGQPAKKYVKALGKIWHTFHFKCASCKSILDSYAEVDGAAYCQPCHQRMSAKTFTRAKRRSFGTEKREQATKAPPWAVKARTSNNAPKSALDVMHKSWFVNGLKKPGSPVPLSPSSSPTPPSVINGTNISPRSDTSSPTFNRPYSPTPISPTPPLSPSLPKATPISTPALATAKPRGAIPPLTPANTLQNQKHPWAKPTEPEAKPKTVWQQPAPKPVVPVTPINYRSVLKPAPASPATSNGVTAAAARGGAGSPATQGTNGYTSINFVPHQPAPKPATRHQNQNQQSHDPAIPQGALNISDILEFIFRPLAEAEIGSLAYQAFPLLAEIHNRAQLHNNIKHKTIYISPSGQVTLVEQDAEDETKVGGTSIKFKAPEDTLSVASDIYSLGVALWTSADYLLDEEEEPALSADFCDFIGGMTDDDPAVRPPIRALMTHVEKYKESSAPYLAALMREVERKKVLRKEIDETSVQKQKSLGKVLLQEIEKGVRLRHVDPQEFVPAAKQTNPHELMCQMIKSFNFRLTKIDISKLPLKPFKMNPRERLMQAVLSGSRLKRALVVAGYDINNLIVPVLNHPVYGTVFRDISALFTVPKVSTAIAQQICTRFTGDPPDLFVATPTDAGVFYASLVGEYFNRGVIVLQNAGRLPRKMEKHSCGYDTLGYVSHSQELQLQKNLIKENTRVVLIDEMLVNGGILEAARIILRETGARIKEVICIAELEGFGGREKIKSFECNVHAMYSFNDNQPEHR
jgi:adenine phosphoribosyltransferase